MISSDTSTGSSDLSTTPVPKRAGPGRPPINIHFDEFGNRVTPKAPYKKRNPGSSQAFKPRTKSKPETRPKIITTPVVELKGEWETSLHDQLIALRPSRIQSAETSRAFLLGDSEGLQNVRTKYEEGRRVFLRKIEGLCRSVGSTEMEHSTGEKKKESGKEAKESKMVDVEESKDDGVQVNSAKVKSKKVEFQNKTEAMEEIEADEDAKMTGNEEEKDESEYIPDNQKRKKRKAHDEKIGFASEEDIIKHSVERSLRKKKHGLRARIMTKEETARIPKMQLRKTPPIFRNEGGDHKKYWHLASEQDRIWFCQRKDLDPTTGDPWRNACLLASELSKGEESDFSPPPVEPMGPYGPFLESDYESGDDADEWPPKFDQCGLGVDRTGFNARGDPLPIRRHVEPRPLFHGNFANSLAADRRENTAKKDRKSLEDRRMARRAERENSVESTAHLTREYLDTCLEEIESKLENEEGSNDTDSTDIENFEHSVPPRPFWDTISTPTKRPVLLRDRPWPHPAELTEWSMAVRHCKLTGEPWPVCRKGMALAAETALRRCTIPLEMLHDRAFEPGTDKFWALMYSKLGGGKTPSEGGKWSTRPDHIKEAAKLMREERPEFCDWIEKEWLVSDIIRRAVANVDRMQEEAWGNRRPDYTREEIRWSPADMSEDFERISYIKSLEISPREGMPNWEVLGDV